MTPQGARLGRKKYLKSKGGEETAKNRAARTSEKQNE
jgi:hypothetical protein